MLMMPFSCRRYLPALLAALSLTGLPRELLATPRWDRPDVVPMVRFGMGVGRLVGSERDQNGQVIHLSLGAYLFSAGTGIEYWYSPSLWLAPEVSYDYRGYDLHGGHTGSFGLGVGYGNLLFISGLYSARFVVGSIDGQLGGGFRHGLSAHFLTMFFGIEVAHQVLYAGGITSHDIQFLFSINPGSLGLLWLK
jgi:hypothetical protein